LIDTLTQQLDGKISRVDRQGSFFKIEFIGLEKERLDVKQAMALS
jgi:hypothetical protein